MPKMGCCKDGQDGRSIGASFSIVNLYKINFNKVVYIDAVDFKEQVIFLFIVLKPINILPN